MLIRDKHGKTHFLDYREKAPAAATRDMYLDAQGNVIPGMSLVGYKASGVPGSVAGLTYAQKHYGKLTLAQDMAPAIKLATDGYVLSDAEARGLQSKNLTRFPASAKIFQRDGDFYKEGDTFKQPELAATLTRIAKDPDDFYKGAMAHQIADFEKAGGGLITAEDLAAYQVKERNPIRGKYHGYDLITAPPPSSGGIVLVEILNILSTYNLPQIGPDRSAAAGPHHHRSLPPRLHGPRRLPRRPRLQHSPLEANGQPEVRRRLASLHRPDQTHAKQRPRPPRRLHAASAPGQSRKRIHSDHPLLHRRRRRHRRLHHHHAQRRLRLRSHRRRPRLPHEQRDGRLHLQGRRPQHATASSRAPPTPSAPASARSPP